MPARRIGCAAAGVAAVMALAACSGGSGGAKQGAVARAGGDGAGGTGSGVSAAASAAGGGTAGSAVTDYSGTAARAPAAEDAVQPGPVTEAKIRTAAMTVDVRGAANVAKQADAAEHLVTAAGGEVDGDERSSGPAASAGLQLRVPPDRLTATLDQLAELGKERRRDLSVTDVTEKVADVDSRVASARDAIVRLRSLYAAAGKVAEIIAVESELSEREADLESLQAQQRALARQTGMATISLTLQTAAAHPVPKKTHTKTSGFVGGLRHGWDGFVDTAAWFATAIGTLLPFLVLALLIGLGGRVVWRRVPHRPGPAPTPAE